MEMNEDYNESKITQHHLSEPDFINGKITDQFIVGFLMPHSSDST